ncbi:hypothetical protein FG382_11805 [Psychrobacillus lasiicapitis]|uniref:Spermidine/putrescine ABC transporter ATP-binding protein n=1 Tax=Psychrobacillus lasiicapitis TaxID=1636719 RepID=A0A544T776_9BACI|nr:hypothetical protein FG382_11805 [Psychrobacillus lasiicapitis]
MSGRSTARKSPIGSTNNRWGIKNTPPLIEVSLYPALTGSKTPTSRFKSEKISGRSTAGMRPMK